MHSEKLKLTIYTLNKSFIISEQHVRTFGVGPALLNTSEGLHLSFLQVGHAGSSVVMDCWFYMVTLRMKNKIV